MDEGAEGRLAFVTCGEGAAAAGASFAVTGAGLLAAGGAAEVGLLRDAADVDAVEEGAAA